jgi:hypothetical protein
LTTVFVFRFFIVLHLSQAGETELHAFIERALGHIYLSERAHVK